jgi:hypothetical protein
MCGLSSGGSQAHVVPLVAAAGVVIPDVLGPGRVQMPFAGDEHTVSALVRAVRTNLSV